MSAWSVESLSRCIALLMFPVLVLAETSGYLCPSLQSLARGSCTSCTKWLRRSAPTRRRRVTDTLMFGIRARLQFCSRDKQISCGISRRSRRRRRTRLGGGSRSGPSRLVPVETPRVTRRPPSPGRTRGRRAPTDTTESRTTPPTSATLAATVHVDKIVFI